MESERNGGKPERRGLGAEFWAWTVLCACALAVMLAFAVKKDVVIAEIPSELDGSGGGGERYPLLLENSPESAGVLYIPLPKGIKPQNLAMENRYLKCELWLFVQTEEVDFYGKNALSGELDLMREGSYETFEDGVLIRLQMQRLMEYRSTLEGDRIAVACHEPGELYQCVAVLDPVLPADTDGEGKTREDVALSVARLVQENLPAGDMRVYLTRTNGRKLSEEDKLALMERVGADFYIRLDVSEAWDEPEVYGIQGSYNGEFFNPDFTNAEFADLLTREVTVAAGNRALGVETLEGDSLMRRLEIPAAQISLGFASHAAEAELLARESYQGKLAEGILKALEKARQKLKADGTAR